jgi:hypothetical protein
MPPYARNYFAHYYGTARPGRTRHIRGVPQKGFMRQYSKSHSFFSVAANADIFQCKHLVWDALGQHLPQRAVERTTATEDNFRDALRAGTGLSTQHAITRRN